MSLKVSFSGGSPLLPWCAVVLFCAIPGALDSLLEVASPAEPNAESLAPLAQAQSIWESDSDGDGFSDELEAIHGSNPFRKDSDRDGWLDSFEFTHGTGILDPDSKPGLEPSIRLQAREEGSVIRVYIGIFPADPHLVDDVQVYLGGRNLPIGEGSPGFRAFNFTPALSHATTGISRGTQAGLSVVLLSASIPSKLLDALGAVTVAASAKIAGELRIHEIEMSTLASGSRVLTSHLLTGSKLSPGHHAYQMLPLDARYGGDDDPEYCELDVDSGTPLGLAGIRYIVQEASCAPAGLTICVSEECESMVGQEILEVDRGFLQDRID